MAIVTIDGQDIEIGDDEGINVIQAAERAGVEIPYYCWHPGLSVVASCRMCLVEVGQRTDEGAIRMGPRLVPACQTPARDQTVVVTASEKVIENRRAVEEYLLLDHPVDCPICDRAGECYLQDYYYDHGRENRRDLPAPFTSRRKDLGPEVTLFTDRCVMCSRCVRFTREISGTAELQVVNRGNSAEIDVFPGYPIDNKLSGNVVDLCPVGALCSRDFLYQQRVWFLKSHPSICTGCSTGCSIFVDQNRETIYRLKPRENPEVNGWWICDEGRLGYKYVRSEHRLVQPRQRGQAIDSQSAWDLVLSRLKKELPDRIETAGNRLAIVLSPMLPCEEIYLLATYAKGINPDVQLALGPVPSSGEDDSYPKPSNGEPVRFTIRAEKCPNRRGVEAIASGLGEDLLNWTDLLEGVRQGQIDSLLITAGYPGNWLDEPDIALLESLQWLVLCDLLDSPAVPLADIVLPTAAWAEKDGCYINHDGRLQVTQRAVRPPGEARSEGRVFWELAGRQRLYRAEDVLKEMAERIPLFSACRGEVPATGIALELTK